MPTEARDTAKAGADQGPEAYLVKTVTQIEAEVFEQLAAAGAARADPKNPGSYIVTDKQMAQSQNIMPKVLDPLGREGWLLCAVNRMECYMFRRLPVNQMVEYRVLSPADLDRMALDRLQQDGSMRLNAFEGATPVLEVTDPAAIRIQDVLPQTLGELARDGWFLTTVNGPQLYFFARYIN